MTKIEHLLSRAQQPGVAQIALNWVMQTHGAVAMQTPREIPSLFSGERRIVYALLPAHCVETRLSARVGARELQTGACTHELNFKNGLLIHRLCAKGTFVLLVVFSQTCGLTFVCSDGSRA